VLLEVHVLPLDEVQSSADGRSESLLNVFPGDVERQVPVLDRGHHEADGEKRCTATAFLQQQHHADEVLGLHVGGGVGRFDGQERLSDLESQSLHVGEQSP
jgi:hypothetical protein